MGTLRIKKKFKLLPQPRDTLYVYTPRVGVRNTAKILSVNNPPALKTTLEISVLLCVILIDILYMIWFYCYTCITFY